MAAKKKGSKAPPEFLEVTTRERILGPKRDRETGQKDILEEGEDCEPPYALATRRGFTKSCLSSISLPTS